MAKIVSAAALHFTRLFSQAIVLKSIGTVLLHLYAGAIARRLKESETMKPIHSIYIPVPSPFKVLEDFIEEATRLYNLDLFSCTPEAIEIESVVTPAPQLNGSVDYVSAPKAVGKSKGGAGMREALEVYKQKFPNISAILIGTRRTDPHGGKQLFFSSAITLV